MDAETRIALLRCVTAHLGVGENTYVRAGIVVAIGSVLEQDKDNWSEPHLDTAVRLAELEIIRFPISKDHAEQLLDTYAARRPDLVARIGILVDG